MATTMKIKPHLADILDEVASKLGLATRTAALDLVVPQGAKLVLERLAEPLERGGDDGE